MRKLPFILGCLTLWLLAPVETQAARLDVVVLGADARPLKDAAVTFHPQGAPPRQGFTLPWPTAISQKDVAFSPHVLIAPVGAEVRFPNLDKVRHHVYSLSKGNRFEIRLYGKEDTRAHVFKSAGIAALGCNIHDRMAAYVVVVDTPFAGLSDAAGLVRLEGVPDGAGEIRVWHESLRDPTTPKAFKAQGGRMEVRLETLPPDLQDHGH